MIQDAEEADLISFMLATPECTQAQPSALCDGGVMINLHRESCCAPEPSLV